jgi:hypothetical protein
VAGVYLSEAHSPPRFLYVLVRNFLRSESGQIQCVKLLQNMVSNTFQHPTPSQPHTVCICCTFAQGRGGGYQERRLEGQ